MSKLTLKYIQLTCCSKNKTSFNIASIFILNSFTYMECAFISCKKAAFILYPCLWNSFMCCILTLDTEVTSWTKMVSSTKCHLIQHYSFYVSLYKLHIKTCLQLWRDNFTNKQKVASKWESCTERQLKYSAEFTPKFL